MNDGLNCKRQQTYNLDWRLQVWHWELVSCGRAVDGDKQVEQLEQLHDVLRTRYPSYIYRKSTHLRHCNVPIHASIVARENSRNCRKLKLYPTYPTAQILQPQTIFFSDRWHTSSAGGNSLQEVEVDVRDFLASKHPAWYYHGLLTLAERWQKTVETDRLFSQNEVVLVCYLHVIKCVITVCSKGAAFVFH